ncbi:hypothetical protein F8M41_019458 [Gigaspora margarita]|uniref:Uncharacterized protein n=1 Tax=Gigaspora margarita TaxID=4874 RepID=A0A8H4EKJ0_GIGMA|nr:hypothetical protein F8M41_019458 [Gigaspora margarita]
MNTIKFFVITIILFATICFIYQYLISGIQSIYLEDGFEINVLGFDSMPYSYPPYRNYRKHDTINDADSNSLKYSEQWYDDDYYLLQDSILI